jgi:phosphate transport system permease protein
MATLPLTPPMDESLAEQILPAGDSPAARRRYRRRRLHDTLTRYYVAAGGISAIVAILLIFVYLLYVVIPLFEPAKLTKQRSFAVPGGTAPTLHLATEEYNEVGLRLTADQRAIFFRTQDGTSLSETQLNLGTPTATITASRAGDPHEGSVALGLSDGKALIVRPNYKITYPNDQRAITPTLSYPLGEQPIEIDSTGAAIRLITPQISENGSTLAATTSDGRLLVIKLETSRSMLDDSITVERSSAELPIPSGLVTHLQLSSLQRELYIATDDGFISYYNIADLKAPKLIDHKSVVPDDTRITALNGLAGGISILIGDSRGTISQWFPVRDDNNRYTLTRIREFHAQHRTIASLVPEHFRKGFAAIDEAGGIGLYHTTAHRTLSTIEASAQPLTHAAFAPRADALLVLDREGTLSVFDVVNKHPEVSWGALWGKIWYESRQQPEYIWQSSSANSDFEPKFSLTPLAFGTLKAAFYAMLFAIPLAICGAIYTGFFMAPRMRGIVKPLIEVMGALPSVILGFLAGLWLAPIIERDLAGVFTLLLLLPIATLSFGFLWSLLPSRIRHRLDNGWEGALLVPVVCASVLLSMSLSQPLEASLFGGNMPAWITQHLGLGFDQRNSLVVGIAMGFAIVPLIFSISEDAIFAVPRHLTIGSLALGATLWQTLVRVVLLTASPGIFSAVMIGLGRAVGETMIVLMATGNTPIMDFNIFEGFRALSANVAVEMPESEVNSTHYRILFLASLVLFIVTFIFNTVAELVRQSLRKKYSSL